MLLVSIQVCWRFAANAGCAAYRTAVCIWCCWRSCSGVYTRPAEFFVCEILCKLTRCMSTDDQQVLLSTGCRKRCVEGVHLTSTCFFHLFDSQQQLLSSLQARGVPGAIFNAIRTSSECWHMSHVLSSGCLHSPGGGLAIGIAIAAATHAEFLCAGCFMCQLYDGCRHAACMIACWL